jgi:hypothetical protein
MCAILACRFLAYGAPSFFNQQDSKQWIVLGVGALATLYLLMRPRLKARRDPLEHRPALSVSQQRQLERDMSNLMVEMLETARQMTAQLDTRAARLELLIQQADQRLAALKSGSSVAPGNHDAASDSPPSLGQNTSLPGTTFEPETPPDPRHAEVWDMADQGSSPHEIARQLNRPNGEIELILALRPH